MTRRARSELRSRRCLAGPSAFGLLATGLLVTGLLTPGCDSKPREPLQLIEPGPSPNASIMPAPLASSGELPARRDGGLVGVPADSAGRLLLPEAGPPEPVVLREDVPLERDPLTTRDSAGVTLQAEFRWLEPLPPPSHDTVAEALRSAREKTVFRVEVDLSPTGRMRFALTSSGFPLPQNTEFRARSEAIGHALVWPDRSKYRVLPKGSLRAVFTERRADVTTLVPASMSALGKGNVQGQATTRVRITTPSGEIAMDKASLAGTGASGDLLCRLLVELIAAEPEGRVCSDGSVPLRAEFKWPSGSGSVFEVSAITRRPDLPLADWVCPPPSALFTQAELPPQASGVLLAASELAELRKREVAPKEPPPPGSPGEGLIAVNREDTLRYVLLDGIPIAWVRPRGEQYVIGPRAGQYTVAWRDFLGEVVTPPKPVTLPARVTLGETSTTE